MVRTQKIMFKPMEKSCPKAMERKNNAAITPLAMPKATCRVEPFGFSDHCNAKYKGQLQGIAIIEKTEKLSNRPSCPFTPKIGASLI